jgi:hypothetical protein
MQQYLISGAVVGFAAGFACRLAWGERTCPVRTGNGVWAMATGVVLPWWIATYPASKPEAGAFVLGAGLGYLTGQLAGLIAEVFRGYGGGGGGGEEPPAPSSPGPDSSVLTMADFLAETYGPAPSEPISTER